MEQYEDIKNELQQELRDLQQNVEQHSSFNKDVWRRAVKRYTRSLYRQNILCVVFLFVMMSASLLFLYLESYWPWWLIMPYVLLFSVLIIDNLVVTREMAHPDWESKDGIRSLRACIQASSSMKRWRVWFYRGFGAIVLTLTYIYLWFNDRQMFVTLLVSSLIAFPFGYLTAKRVNKRFKDLGEEIDELLKDE